MIKRIKFNTLFVGMLFMFSQTSMANTATEQKITKHINDNLTQSQALLEVNLIGLGT